MSVRSESAATAYGSKPNILFPGTAAAADALEVESATRQTDLPDTQTIDSADVTVTGNGETLNYAQDPADKTP